ncbi:MULTISPECIES: DUF6457 domain-containing protein [unclassified Curtobacterium]|uniref:DUF6457 domain-containing protein n=1 Tax=unclassified Curtobacterium TaxID=257496 RepID=UPI0008240852|nr:MULTISPECIES: DUF6457 domain-containing protein [unclassified Curtobacterium]WIA99557.1 DUF6457 domain-containing protein [Curtobacterium sp. MCBA15_012]
MTTDDVLAAWTAELAEALGFPEDFTLDRDVVLDLARDAAHGVARPAAPLTTFLVGYAAGLRGGSPADVEAAAATATRLASARDAGAGPSTDDGTGSVTGPGTR